MSDSPEPSSSDFECGQRWGDTEEVRERESSSEAEYAQHWCTDNEEETSSPAKRQKVRKFKTDA